MAVCGLGESGASVQIDGEFHVNTYTPGYQTAPEIAGTPSGDFVVVWVSNPQDGSEHGLFAQRFDSAGTRRGAEFQVNSYTTFRQYQASIAVADDGGFVVVWPSPRDPIVDYQIRRNVFGQRYDSAGAPLGGEFLINTYTTREQRDPTVAIAADGDFLVAWASRDQDSSNYGVFAQLFDSGGVGQASEFLVNTYTTNIQRRPAVAPDDAGGFLVVWESFGQGTQAYGVFARRVGSAGAALGSEIQVAGYTANQIRPAIAAAGTGSFIVTWSSSHDGAGYGIFARRLDSMGTPQAAEFQVNSYTTGSQHYAAVAADEAGGFVVAWRSQDQDGSGQGVFARRFDSVDTSGPEFQVSDFTIGGQERPAVAADAQGDFVIVWQDYPDGVRGRRFAGGPVVTATPSATATPTPTTTSTPTVTPIATATPSATATPEPRPAGPVGQEFQVNAFTAKDQSYPAAARDAEGDFVVVWQSRGQDDPGALYPNHGIFGRRFTSSGARVGAEFQVNSHSSGYEYRPAVAMSSVGDFVVVWTSQPDQDGSDHGVFGQRFASSGSAVAAEFQVNTYTFSAQKHPDVATNDDGDFVVVWRSTNYPGSGGEYGIFAQRFANTGAPAGGEFRVNSFTLSQQRYATAAMDADGDFVVTWQSYGQDGSRYGIFAQRFSSSGAALGGEFQVNSRTSNYQYRPDVAIEPGGDFVIAWTGRQQDEPFQYGQGVFAQRFASSGARVGGEFQVNTVTLGSQAFPSLASDGEGGFVAVWGSGQDVSSVNVFGQRFTSSGAALSAEFRVNSYTDQYQGSAAVVSTGGHFVVVWASFYQDGDLAGVFGQLFAVPAPADVDGVFGAQALTDGLLIVRYIFGFRGQALIQGAVPPGCTQCSAAEIEAAIAAMGSQLDIDGDGEIEPLTDGLLLLRYLFGFAGQVLVQGAVDTANCMRCTPEQIEAHIETLIEPP